MGFGRSIEIFLVDGRPEGLITAKVFNWTGQILRVPRLMLKEALSRDEASFTGVYLLLGEQEGQRLAYVGEGEEIAKRIVDHDSKRDWWSEVVLITTSANELNKAHVKYLESRLVEIAKTAGVIPLENANTPTRPSLSEAARANMEEFLDTLGMVLPALGIDVFVNKKRPNKPHVSMEEARPAVEFQLDQSKGNVRARARLVDDEFVIQIGSTARFWVGTGNVTFGYKELQASLIESGVLSTHHENAPLEFSENYAFNSPSAAAAVVLGRAANGRTEWKVVGSGETFGAWDEARLQLVTA